MDKDSILSILKLHFFNAPYLKNCCDYSVLHFTKKAASNSSVLLQALFYWLPYLMLYKKQILQAEFHTVTIKPPFKMKIHCTMVTTEKYYLNKLYT